MTPLAERDQIFVSAIVWRRPAPSGEPASPTARAASTQIAALAEPALWDETPAGAGVGTTASSGGTGAPMHAARPVWPTQPALASLRPSTTGGPPAPLRAQPAATQQQAVQQPVAQDPAAPAGPPRPHVRPTVMVRGSGTSAGSLPSVERALQQAPEDRTRGWHERVVVVPGGHRPGKPDQLQRDQARARLPLPGPARIVVLGCTAGAGQTTTTLLTGQLLASLRGEAVAVLDIGSGPGSLTEQARRIPRLLPGHRDRSGAAPGSGRDRGLQVVTAEAPAEEPADAGKLIDAVVARYQITIADPAAPHVPRAVQAADQLVLVAPASGDAAGALAMTLEWLEAHGNADAARSAVTVLNGVSAATVAHVDKAAAVAAGRSRAIVRVPWDGRLADGGAVGIATVQAFTALGGVLIAGLATSAREEMRIGAGRP